MKSIETFINEELDYDNLFKNTNHYLELNSGDKGMYRYVVIWTGDDSIILCYSDKLMEDMFLDMVENDRSDDENDFSIEQLRDLPVGEWHMLDGNIGRGKPADPFNQTGWMGIKLY